MSATKPSAKELAIGTLFMPLAVLAWIAAPIVYIINRIQEKWWNS